MTVMYSIEAKQYQISGSGSDCEVERLSLSHSDKSEEYFEDCR